MSFESEFRGLMASTVTIEEVASMDEYGKRTYGTGTTYQARVRQKIERVFNLQGREEWAKTKVWVAPHSTTGAFPTISPRSRVTLPDGTQPPLIAFERIYDENGPHHMILWFGDTSRVV